MSAPRAPLYTPEILALAVSLADRPLDPALPLAGEARSRTCGSTVKLACSADAEGRIDRLGLQVSACAIGQAAAALFARRAVGADRLLLAEARSEIAAWLAGAAGVPAWAEIELLAPARAHSARHCAVLLAWDAALDALSKHGAPG
ncbi:MAG: iron-sulfur cluster assembly scaffold protein [Cypionkella sp.]